MSDDEDNLISYAFEMSKQGNFSEAEKLCKELLANNENSSVGWGMLGAILAQQNRADEALQALERSIKLDNTDETTLTNYGSVLSILTRLDEAEIALKQSIALNPLSYPPWFMLGNIYVGTKRSKLAVDAYRKAIEINSLEPPCWGNLGSALTNQKQLQDAENAFRKALDLDQNYALPWKGLAFVLAEMNQIQNAVNAYRQYLLLEPHDGRTWNDLGVILRKLRLKDEEEVAYRNAIKYAPDDARPWHNLGIIYYERGQLTEAEAAYRKATVIDPSQKASWSGLHRVLTEIGGRLEETQNAFVRGTDVIVADKETGEKKVFDMPEDLVKSVTAGLTTMAESLNKGYQFMSQGRYDEAEHIFRHVTKNYPDSHESKLLFADLLVERGKCKEALPIIEDAIKAIPHSGFPWEVRGRALGKLGRMKEAKESMKRALEIEPRNRQLKEVVDYWYREHNRC